MTTQHNLPPEPDDASKRAQSGAEERDSLIAAIEDYSLWEPGRKGHAAAHRVLMDAARGARQ